MEAPAQRALIAPGSLNTYTHILAEICHARQPVNTAAVLSWISLSSSQGIWSSLSLLHESATSEFMSEAEALFIHLKPVKK